MDQNLLFLSVSIIDGLGVFLGGSSGGFNLKDGFE